MIHAHSGILFNRDVTSVHERRCPRWYGGEPFADGEGELPFQDDVEGEYAVYLQVKVACTPTLHVR